MNLLFLNMPAPIALFCYNRPDHLKLTVESLKENSIAKDSTLFIFSDGAKSDKLDDKIKVDEVREYIGKVTGFKNIIIQRSKENKGLAKSVIEGVTEILEKFEKVIVMEDDLICSKDFLLFMNNALDFYKDNSKIGSISGFSFMLEKHNLKDDYFFIKRASSWGWATWKNRWLKVDWALKKYDEFISDSKAVDDFKNAGRDLIPMLKKQNQSLIDSWAIRWTFFHYEKDLYCLVPKYSKIRNIGTDGSGTNFTNTTKKYQTSLSEGIPPFPLQVKQSIETINYIRNTFKTSIYRRCINYFVLSRNHAK